jgi:hypothetical protein
VSLRKEDVSRLDVAVNDSLAVSVGESVCNFGGDAQCLLDGKLSLALQALS